MKYAMMAVLMAGYLGDQPELTSRATQSTVTVTVKFVPPDTDLSTLCNIKPSENYVLLGCYLNGVIVAVEPKDFNDHKRLEVLGHELWHALGASHK